MKTESSNCLLLNADYVPLSIINWQRAIIWNMKYEDNKNYGIDIVDFYKNDYINGVNGKKYAIPCVARTKRFFKINRSTIVFSRKNIFIRDDYTCQYCGSKLENDLTYDHIIPKSRWDYNKGSPTSWTNIITACLQCNRKKGDKTPKEAKMSLKKLPMIPTKTIRYLPITHHLHKIKDSIPNEWKIYLPNSYLE